MSKKHDGCPHCDGKGIVRIEKTYHPDGRVKSKNTVHCPA